MKNPGHGHPMRPEYLLTSSGEELAPWCRRLLDGSDGRRWFDFQPEGDYSQPAVMRLAGPSSPRSPSLAATLKNHGSKPIGSGYDRQSDPVANGLVSRQDPNREKRS